MENLKENFNFNFSEAGNEIVIRHGDALPPIPKVKTVIKGVLSAPGNYFEKRKRCPEKSIVMFSREDMRIKFLEDSDDYLAAEIDGSLSMNSDLKDIGINASTTYSTKQLASLLKMNRIHFVDKDLNAEIVSKLNNFQATINTEIEKSQDNRGNSKGLIDKKIISNMPTSFSLNMPIFKGGERFSFFVEICFDSSDSSVKCWLESPELIDLFITQRDAMIDEQLKRFDGLIIIEQ